jgi:uncharacterized protein (TIGR02246 family)
VLVVSLTPSLWSQASTQARDAAESGAAGDVPQAIASRTQAFVDAYNRGDAAAIAQMFTERGEFIDVSQTVYSGRDAILEEFTAFLDVEPRKTLTVDVDSVRPLTDSLCVEDGRITIIQGDLETGPAYVSRYTSIYVREGNAWKIASLRDLSAEAVSPGDHLQALQWMIGEWVSETEEGLVQHSIYWADDGNYILGDFEIRDVGDLGLTGSYRVGWDPQAKQIRTWIFDSAGGFLTGTWSVLEEGWMVKLSGVRPDGAAGSSTNYYLPQSDDRILWRSTDRVVDGEPYEDVEVALVRQPPAPAGRADEGSEDGGDVDDE